MNFCVTFEHVSLCLHILASIFQDGENPFSVTKLPDTFTSVSVHLRYIQYTVESCNGFLAVHERTRTHALTHAHEFRLLGASCS